MLYTATVELLETGEILDGCLFWSYDDHPSHLEEDEIFHYGLDPTLHIGEEVLNQFIIIDAEEL